METRTVPAQTVEIEIVIRFDVGSGVVSVTGCDANPLVALGLLDYALARVRRHLTMSDITHEMKNAPRVALASGLPQ